MGGIPYASAVRSLMYAHVYMRPDIAYVVVILCRYHSNPGVDHWKAAKKVIRYIQGTKDYMLMYRRADYLEVIGYSDVDFVGCMDSRKSTFGYRIHASWWSHILEERGADIDCYFHYGD